jgi:hypothetical protein
MSPFSYKDWRNATAHDGGGDTSTPLSAAAFEDLETRVSHEISDVKSYGAMGDGATDDTVAIQDAIDATAADGGGMVFFPAGVYETTSPVNLMSGVALFGTGPSSEIHNANTGGTAAHALQHLGGTADRISDLTIKDLSVTGNASSGNGIHILYSENLGTGNMVFDNVKVLGHGVDGIYWERGDALSLFGCDIGLNGGRGIQTFEGTNLLEVFGGVIHGNTLQGGYMHQVVSNSSFWGVQINDNKRQGLVFQAAEQPTVKNCGFNRNGGDGVTPPTGSTYPAISLTGTGSKYTVAATIEGNLFGDNNSSGYDIACDYVEGVRIVGNYFYGVSATKTAYVRLATYAKGVSLQGNYWFTTAGSPGKVTTSGGADISYVLYDDGDNNGATNERTQLNYVDQLTANGAASVAEQGYVSGESFVRWQRLGSGAMVYGNGSGATDTTGWSRSGAGALTTPSQVSTATLVARSGTGTQFTIGATGIGAFNGAQAAKQTVTGAKGGNAALTSLIAALVAYGLITDTTT